MPADPADPIDAKAAPALLTPSAWFVQCPCCGASIEIEQVEEDIAGAYCASGTDMLPLCEVCHTLIEVLPASVQEAYPNAR